MTDLDVVNRAASLMRVPVYAKAKNYRATKQPWVCRVYGRHAIAWMLTLYGLMGERRRQAIWSIVLHWRRANSRYAEWIPRDEKLRVA